MTARDPARVREAVVRALGAEHVRAAAPPADAVDDRLPAVVARPASAAEVAELLALAAREGLAVIPTGAGTKRALGNLPERADVLLELGALAALHDWSPRDGVLGAGAALGVADAERLVAADAHTLGGDWPVTGRATLGGCAAAGRPPLEADGPAGPRWSVIAVEVAHPDGTLRRHGARVAKNVAGFDLVRLQVGALGTLGVITELTIRARPRAARDLGGASAAPSAIRAAALGPDGRELAVVEVRVPAGRLPAQRDADVLRVDEPVASAAARERFQRWLGEWRALTAQARGLAIVHSAPPAWKRGLDVWCGEPPAALAMMRELKALYDPARVLNPGRYVAGL